MRMHKRGPKKHGLPIGIKTSMLALALVLLCPGCGTLITQIDGPLFAPGDAAFDWDESRASPIYSGTRLAYGGAIKSEAYYVWIVDLPFSFLADTGLLPLTISQDLMARWAGPKIEEVLQPEVATPPAR